MNYTLRLAGLTAAGTRARAEAAIASVFGENAAAFSLAVGPIGQDLVTHWWVDTKTRPEVLPYYVAITRATHESELTTEDLDPQHQDQRIMRGAELRGAWVVYLNQQTGEADDKHAWLASLGLEIKQLSLFGGELIDMAILSAQTAEPTMTPEALAQLAARVNEELALVLNP